MTSTPAAQQPPIPASRRHIIKRPRLTRMLDETNAGIIMLIAPAGYGKTTLAREWLSQGDRRYAWYRVTPSSVDVARLAAELADTFAPFDADAPTRMAAHLRTVAESGLDVDVLARLLSERLRNWPSNTWLV